MLDRHSPSVAIPELERRIRSLERGETLDDRTLSQIREITKQNMYNVSITATRGNILRGGVTQTMLIAHLYSWNKDVTDKFHSNAFVWTRNSGNETEDATWNAAHSIGEKYITITKDDVGEQATFFCTVIDKDGNEISEQIVIATDKAFLNLEPFKGQYILDESGEVIYEEVQVPVYETVRIQALDENDNPIIDENGDPVYEIVRRQAVDESGEPIFMAQNVARETTPPVPYQKGDVWITASGGMRYCTSSKGETESFDLNDWTEYATNNSVEGVSEQIETMLDVMESIEKNIAKIETVQNNGLSEEEIERIKATYGILESTVSSVINGNYALLADLNEYKEYIKSIVDITDKGVEVTGRDIDGNPTKFKTILSSESLDFYENDIRTAYIESQKFNIENGVIRNSLAVGKHIITTDDDSYEIEYLG